MRHRRVKSICRKRMSVRGPALPSRCLTRVRHQRRLLAGQRPTTARSNGLSGGRYANGKPFCDARSASANVAAFDRIAALRAPQTSPSMPVPHAMAISRLLEHPSLLFQPQATTTSITTLTWAPSSTASCASIAVSSVKRRESRTGLRLPASTRSAMRRKMSP